MLRARGLWNTRLRSRLLFTFSLAFVLFLPTVVTNVHALGPTYTLSANPVKINELQSTTISFAINGGSALTSYTFQVTVAKPSGGVAGQAYHNLTLTTDSYGDGSGSVVYPSTGWVGFGTIQIDIVGIYNVTVAETAPMSVTTGFPFATFQAYTALTVTLTSPSAGRSVLRGETVNFVATVYDINGLPVTNAVVYANAPQGWTFNLYPTTTSGTYSANYTIQVADPLGTWNITTVGYNPKPSETNFGTDIVLVTIALAPSWPASTSLTISSVTASSLLLSWPQATSNVGVGSYRIYVNGLFRATVPANTTSYTVTGLTPGATYQFWVKAVDRNGNASTSLAQTQTMPSPSGSEVLLIIAATGLISVGLGVTVLLLMRRNSNKASWRDARGLGHSRET